MNRDELDKRNTAAITHWSVTMRDMAKVPQGLLDDLARIADEHAAAPVMQSGRTPGFSMAVTPPVDATTLRDDYDSHDTPPLAAASPESTGTPPSPSSVARTRTRTRRNTE